MPRTLTTCSHLAVKRGVFYFRRVLSKVPRREVAVSLRTCNYREAEHLARVLTAGFNGALARARRMTSSDPSLDLAAILRDYLNEALAENLRAEVPRGGAVPLSLYPLAQLEAEQQELRRLLSERDPSNIGHIVDSLMERHALPETMRAGLGIGLLEAEVAVYEAAMQRARGEVPLVLRAEAPEAKPTAEAVEAPSPAPRSAPTADAPLASSLVEPYFVRRETIDHTRHQVMGQERATLRLFFEVCGDRPPADYQRGDVTRFLDTLRKMPALYNRSRKAPTKSVADLIAEADATNAPRLTDKTVKRHLTALSQFFRFAMDQGQLGAAARIELVTDHRFKAPKKARDQRDAWASEELGALFKTPVWAGRDANQVAKPGPHIIRDAMFWLPILALFHGGRLEEFADLYGRDLQCDAGTWFLNIMETEADEAAGKKGRSLKTANATRALPLHPEVIRLGFVQYVRTKAPHPDDPLFPDLPPQGKDGRRGARFTRNFIYYRQQVGVYRRGVGMHSFRHTAITRLTDAITDFQQKRHRDYLMGHSGGATEGDVRYDKGPGLKAAAATLALLAYPEVDLSRLHVRDEPAEAA